MSEREKAGSNRSQGGGKAERQRSRVRRGGCETPGDQDGRLDFRMPHESIVRPSLVIADYENNVSFVPHVDRAKNSRVTTLKELLIRAIVNIDIGLFQFRYNY